MRFVGGLFCCVVAHLVSSVSTGVPPYACDSTQPLIHLYTFCNISQPINARVQNLISLLTLDEKISQLVNSAAPIDRLGIPAYEWWSEALHGVTSKGKGTSFNGLIRSGTSFPQVILTAASFNPLMWYRIAQAIGIEARAVYNSGQSSGMTYWAPNINIFRDPRWGRGQETPGEDPLLTSRYAVAYVRGLQGDTFKDDNSTRGGGPEHLRASACCKHFTAYDFDNWNSMTRYVFNARVSKQDLADTYQPPFRSCVEEGRVSGIMCSYNRVNGVPTCADYHLLTETAREKWGFYGYITSDCDAVSIIHKPQGYAMTPEDAVADVLKAGMDVNCGSYLKKHTKSAVEQKKLSESDIDRALHNLFSIRMRLGLFNGNPKHLIEGNITPNQVCSQEHQNLALEAARDGIVLLKNSAKLLPLSKTRIKTLAVLGPNADIPEILIGNYGGPPCKSISPLSALKNYIEDVQYHSGCDNVACNTVSINKAVEVVKKADAVILVMGLDQSQEREEMDRLSLLLPGKQESLITKVAEAAKRPVILVLLCGGPVDVSFAKSNPKIGSILWAGYPGQSGGIALAEIIFGDHNPGGRLPITWYPQNFTKVPMTDMRMRPDPTSGYPGRTYRFYNGEKVFEFGYGLSYTTYSYQITTTKKRVYLNHQSKKGTLLYDTQEMGSEICDGLKFSAFVRVQNGEGMAGRHPVLLYVESSKSEGGSPIKQLVDFRSVHLDASEVEDMEFVVSPCKHFSRTDEEGNNVMEGGTYFLVVGEAKHQMLILA